MTKERAIQVYEQCRKQAIGSPWCDQLRKVLTYEEIAFVNEVWKRMSLSSCFADAFLSIVNQKES